MSKKSLKVKKRDGSRVDFDSNKINRSAERACKNLEGVSASELVLDTSNGFHDNITTEEIDKSLILTARGKSYKDPNWGTVAARILASCVYKEVLGESVDSDTFDSDYRTVFIKNIKKGVKEGILSEKMLDFDLKRLAKKLVPNRDDTIDYVGMQNLADRYFLRNRSGKLLETPQSFYMRVAMGISLAEFKFGQKDPNEVAEALYGIYSQKLATPSTPTLFNAGTTKSQLSSCFKPDAPIVTSNGFLPISEVKIGDLVLTSDGSYNRVTNVANKPNTKKIINFKIHGIVRESWKFSPTEDHKIFAIKKSKIACIRGEGGKARNCLYWKGKRDFCFKKARLYTNDCIRLSHHDPEPSWFSATDLEVGDFVAVSYPYKEVSTKIDCLKFFDPSGYRIDDGYIKKINNGVTRGNFEASKNVLGINPEIDIDYNFGLFCGYYLSEGYTDGNVVRFTFNSKETEYLNETVVLAREIFGGEINPKININNDGSSNVDICSTLASKVIYGLFGSGFNLKTIPQVLMEASKEFAEGLIVGAYRGDGFISKDSNLGLIMCNKTMTHQIFLLLLKCGVLPVWSETFMSSLGNEQPYGLFINLCDAPKLIKRINKSGISDFVDKEDSAISSKRFFHEGIAYYQIADKEITEYDGMVYDLEVENVHDFCVNGIVAHNCYLSSIPDSLDGIFDSLWQEARKSKHAGGLGFHATSIRATGSYIKGTNGTSSGLIPWLKIYNDMLLGCNQAGRRPGSGCAYLEPWHVDVEDFIELRRSNGEERRRCHDLNIALWCPDLFFKRIESDGIWTLFCPSECPELHELYGDEFEKKYEYYEGLHKEKKLKLSRQIKAKDLWKSILKCLFETSAPWLTYKDSSNKRYPNKHEGVLHGSNLCTEIFIHTKPSEYEEGEKTKIGETAVCTLASLNLNALSDENGKLDKDKTAETIKWVIRGLDNVVEINYYPTKEAKNSALKHRNLGMGSLGWSDLYAKKGIPSDSDKAVELADSITEFISYHAINASSDLARERGNYASLEGSDWSKGIVPIDNYKGDIGGKGKMDWDTLREKVKGGMRNANVMAVAPNASIAYQMGTEQSHEPFFSVLFTYENKSGNYYISNKHFVRHMQEEKIWSPAFAEAVKAVDGDVLQLDIPQKYKDLYKKCFDRDMFKLIDACAARQKWVDQGLSFNLYNGGTSLKYLNDIYMHCWKRGLKSTYYLRNKPASKVSAVTGTAVESEEEKKKREAAEINAIFDRGRKAAEVGEACESCQG